MDTDEDIKPTSAVKTAKGRWRRFSLANLVLLSISAGFFMIWLHSLNEIKTLKSKNQELSAANTKLREELGALTIDNPSAVYVRGVKTLDDKRWIWRMYLPATAKYKLSLITDGIPDRGLPDGGGNSSSSIGEIEKGEFTVDAAVNLNAKGEWIAIVAIQGSTMRLSFNEPKKWMVGGNCSTSGIIGPKVRKFTPDEPIELLRLREHVQIEPNVTGTVSKPSSGLLIYLERIVSE